MAKKPIYMHPSSRWREKIAFSALCFFVMLSSALLESMNVAAFSPSRSRPRTTLPAQVSINISASRGRLPATAFGINTAVWDYHLQDPVVSGLLSSAGVKIMRYPGGSTADMYHWQTNTIEPNNTFAGPASFDNFMQVVHRVGAQPIITVNYGSGTPEEAAAWVRYANITKGYHIKYWEIGNEIYGNGTYGADWEYDIHMQKGPAAYAYNALQFISAMKAVDPTIQIGIVLTTPGDWPDGIVAPGNTMDWNHTVLSIIGSHFDFGIAHWYGDYAPDPFHISDAGLLANPAQIPAKVSTLRALFAQYAGASASQKQIMITETNSVPYSPGKQTVSLVNALFLDEDYMTWLQSGVTTVDWWDTHNSIVTNGDNSPSLYGTTLYGDYGMLSAGDSADGLSEPPVNTPFPPYYGLQMLTKLGSPGDTMVSAISSQRLVSVFAVRQANGNLAVLLINTDPNNSYQVSFAGRIPGPFRTIYFYGQGSTVITIAPKHAFSPRATQVIPPYSLTTVVFSSR